MKLDAWMGQDHSLEESLRLIESLCQAVNEVHDRGEALGGLQPDRIEVDPGGRCDLSEAGGGSPSPDYAPPDGQSDAAGDVYAAGVITWEILAGRSVDEAPQHLAEVRPDIAKELADAIMACLERSADWRPKDLTFLAQMAAARQKGAGRAPDKRRGARAHRPTPARRTRSRQQGRRTWPLLAALVVVLGLAAFAWKQFAPGGFPWARTSSTPPAPAAPPPATPPVTEPAPPADVPPAPTDAPATPPTTEPAADQGGAAPPPDAAPPAPPAPEPEPASRPETEPVAPPAPVAEPVPSVAPPRAQTAPRETPVTSRPAPAAPPRAAPATSRPEPPPAPRPETEAAAPAAPPPPAPPVTPAVLTAVSPLEVKRPGKVLVDLRGEGFLEQHRVRILPVKKVPRGITVVRHKRVSDSLITVLIELTDDADPGDYAFAVEDGLGQRTEPLIFKVTK